MSVEWIAQTEEQKTSMKERDSLVTRPPFELQPLPSIVEVGSVGVTIAFLRNRLVVIRSTSETSPFYAAGIADIEAILAMLDNVVGNENSRNGGAREIAMLEAKLEDQQAQLAHLFDSGDPDEDTVQILFDKIEKTESDIANGGVSTQRKGLALSIERFYREISRHADATSNTLPSTRELQEYEAYSSFLNTHTADSMMRYSES